ncbi:MAG: DUF1450 domain-containing protein [Geobacter sp.]|nr:DUF1450 domain-containing protein [Geobacter sp.]
MKIRFCGNNKGVKKIGARLKEEFPELDIKRKDCMKKCGVCKREPFALVDGLLVTAEEGEDLYQRIVAHLR